MIDMLLCELFENDKEMLTEAARVTFTKKGNRVTKKYRCVTGAKRGRTVNTPSACGKFKADTFKKRKLTSRGFRKLKFSSIKNRLKGYRSQKAKTILGR